MSPFLDSAGGVGNSDSESEELFPRPTWLPKEGKDSAGCS